MHHVPRFSVKDLLIATTLVAVGMGMLSVLFSLDVAGGLAWVLLFGGFTLIGAGLFTPFNRPWIGAAVGFGIILLVMISLFILVEGLPV